jgi:hypothetical protein
MLVLGLSAFPDIAFNYRIPPSALARSQIILEKKALPGYH